MFPKFANYDLNNVKIDVLFEKSQILFSGWEFTPRLHRPRRLSPQAPVYWTLDHLSGTIKFAQHRSLNKTVFE